jgi:sialate O-acetylesterase
MAVTTDIGDPGDIHPRNKQDVGLRLALAARKVAYGQELVFSGPMYQRMEVKGDRIILHFDHTGTGLVARDKYGYLRGFAIAGADRTFHWAKAEIKGNTVEVYAEAVPNPVAVRFAWADDATEANLFNKEGLPASPFRTDDWPGQTLNRHRTY